MTRHMPLALLTTASLLAAALVAGCGRSAVPDHDMGSMQSPATPATADTSGVTVSLATSPDPPRAGSNTFTVTVSDAGQPVTDAEVFVDLLMPAMPAMNMPEMRNRVPLPHEAGGRYVGAGDIVMGGPWEVTVVVSRTGEEIGRTTRSITTR